MDSGPNWAHRLKLKIDQALGRDIFLCHTCQWNWRSACNRPERPNATWCPDYHKKGK